jgi:hypothetical protein
MVPTISLNDNNCKMHECITYIYYKWGSGALMIVEFFYLSLLYKNSPPAPNLMFGQRNSFPAWHHESVSDRLFVKQASTTSIN